MIILLAIYGVLILLILLISANNLPDRPGNKKPPSRPDHPETRKAGPEHRTLCTNRQAAKGAATLRNHAASLGMSMKMLPAVAICAALAISAAACSLPPPGATHSTYYIDQMSEEETAAINRYVDCVKSRFPLRANRWAFVNSDAVAEQLAEGNLDRHGMAKTFSNLGCGDLSAG